MTTLPTPHENYPWPNDQREYIAKWIGLLQAAQYGEGISPVDGTGLLSDHDDFKVVTAGSGLQVTVGQASLGNAAFVRGDTDFTAGLYFCYTGNQNTVTLDAADGSNPRIDSVVLEIQDASTTGANDRFLLTKVTGTPNASASLATADTYAPTLGDNRLLLCHVYVPTSFTGPFVDVTHITDRRFLAYQSGKIIDTFTKTSDTGPTTSADIDSFTWTDDGIHDYVLDFDGDFMSASAGAGTALRMRVWTGASQTGTQLGGFTRSSASAGYGITPGGKIILPTLGSVQTRTVYINISASTGNATLTCAAAAPFFAFLSYK